jgi:transcriptional regulator with XRE-family HTH domain
MDYLSKKSSKYLPEKDNYRLRYKHNFDIPIDFIESLHIKKEKKTYKDNIVLIKLLSEKKKGDKNPNYGVERSAEHCKKLSESTFGKHRKITNDVIKNVREEKDIKQQEIADKYNISRAQVQKIVSGKLIPTDEVYEKKQKNSRIDILIDLGYSKEEASIISGAITKRKIEGKYMVNIWFFGKIRKNQTIDLPFKNTAKNLAQYISDKLQTDISEDMIKNIWNKKTSLYKIDFNGEIPITFENYRENIIPDDVFFNLFS